MRGARRGGRVSLRGRRARGVVARRRLHRARSAHVHGDAGEHHVRAARARRRAAPHGYDRQSRRAVGRALDGEQGSADRARRLRAQPRELAVRDVDDDFRHERAD